MAGRPAEIGESGAGAGADTGVGLTRLKRFETFEPLLRKNDVVTTSLADLSRLREQLMSNIAIQLVDGGMSYCGEDHSPNSFRNYIPRTVAWRGAARRCTGLLTPVNNH